MRFGVVDLDALDVPFRIEGPALVSFSGGRTSAYMLWRIIQAHGGRLPDDVYVCFANTGKEREETLVFIREIELRWGVRIYWLERRDWHALLVRRAKRARQAGFPSAARDIERRVVREASFDTADRSGTPFLALIRERNFLPNPVTRFCTQELKIRVMKAFMIGRGHERWTNVVGLRADEPGRVSRQRATEGAERWDLAFPLFEAGIDKEAVLAFWRCQPFDLQLRSWEGNCDLCFLKGRKKKERIIRDRPDLAPWWADAEAEAVLKRIDELREIRFARFRAHGPSYAEMMKLAAQPMLPFDAEDLDGPDDMGDCFCGAD